jgi:predicted dehydrogenase
VRIALAGLGSAAERGHLPAIAQLVSRGIASLVGAADPSEDARSVAAARLQPQSPPLFASAEQMLDAVDCELLVIAAEPPAHADLIERGLAGNLHVVCEKPLVLTREHYERVAQAHARRPDLAIVPVHQYRYSPTWISISRWARMATRLRVPFRMVADVERPTTDSFAASAWRTDLDRSGGMLADHGVHYLSLAWTIDPHLDVLAGARTFEADGERSVASLRLGSGVLTIRVRTGAPARRTAISLEAAGAQLSWCDEALAVALGGRPVLARPVAGLADRAHVDALYGRFYADLARNLRRPAWRAQRTAEALLVGRALLELLERPAVAV